MRLISQFNSRASKYLSILLVAFLAVGLSLPAFSITVQSEKAYFNEVGAQRGAHRSHEAACAQANFGYQENCSPGSCQGNSCDCTCTHTVDGTEVLGQNWVTISHVCPAGMSNPNTGTCTGTSINTQGGSCGNMGNPINAFTGNKYQEEVDFEGVNGLKFVRYYNSYRRHSTAMGFGWTTNFHSNRLNIYEDEMIVESADGAIEEWTRSPGGQWNGKSDSRILLEDHELGYQITKLDNSREVYSFTGRMLSQTDIHGFELTYHYGTRLDSVTNSYGQSIQFAYSEFGDLEAVILPNSEVIRFSFEYERLAAVIYPDNTPLDDLDNPRKTYNYDSLPSILGLSGVTDENNNNYSTWVYSPSTGRATSTYQTNGVNRFDFDYSNLEYTTEPRVHVTNPLGKSSTYHLESINGTPKLIRVEGESTSNCAASNSYYTYHPSGYLQTVTDEKGFVTHYAENTFRGLIIRETQGMIWSGGVGSSLVPTNASRRIHTGWSSDLIANRIYQQYDSTTDTWESYLREDFLRTPENRIETYTQTDQQTPTNVRTTNYSYTYYDTDNVLLQTATVDGPRQAVDVSDVTVTSFNNAGFVSSVANALGHTVTYQNYNGAGQAREVIDTNGVETILTYTPRGWLETTTTVHPSGDPNLNITTTFAYDGVGQIILIVLDDGQMTHFEYDDARRLTAIQNHIGQRYEFVLDNAGNVTSESIERLTGETVYQLTRAYDELSRVMDIFGNDGQHQHFDYDVSNNLTDTINVTGAVNSQEPDALNRLQTAIDPYLGETNITYDAHDRITAVTDARDNTTTYTYDGLGNLIQLDSPDAGITTYEHDEAGNITQSTDANGVVTEFTYDALNRLLTVSYPASPNENVTYFYDDYAMDAASPDPDENSSYAIGRLTGVDSEHSSIRYYYDYRGNITKQKETVTTLSTNNTYSVRYTYRFDNQLETVLYPTGMLVTFLYNNLGQVENSIANYPGIDGQAPFDFNVASNMTYMPFGPRSQLEFGNGIVETHDFDLDYRLINIVTAGTSFLEQSIYEYDLNNNIDEIIDLNNPFDNQSFNFDLLDRLDDATGVYGAIDYGYDAVGNRLTKDINTSEGLFTNSYIYAPDSNRLMSITSDDGSGPQIQDFDYDFAGNLLGDLSGTNTINYNSGDRPTTWYQTPVEMEYFHNPLGQRVQKTPVSGGVSYSLTSEPGVFSEEEYVIPETSTWDDISLALYGTTATSAQLESAMVAQGYTVNSDSLLAADLPSSIVVSEKASDQEDSYVLDTANFVIEELVTIELNLDHSELSGNGAGPLTYSQLNGLGNTDSTLTKTNPDGWGDGIFAANELIPAGEDGWVEYQLVAGIVDVNLSLSTPAASVYTPPFQFWLENGYISIYENGAYVDYGAFPAYQMGDVLRIERAGSTVQYFQNGTLLHTSVQVSTEDLTAKGFFYPQGASVAVSASFSSSASPDAFYTVQAGDTWSSITALLYADAEGASALETALNSPALIDGTDLTGLPNALSYDTAQAVDPYLAVPSGATWESLAVLMYGSAAATEALETALSASYPLASTDQIPASAFASSIVVVTSAPTTDFALITSPFITERATTVDYDLDSSQLSGNGAGPLTYSQLNGLSNSDSTLTKTNPDGWGDGTFSATEIIPAGEDGWVEYQLVAGIADVNINLSSPASSIYAPAPFQFWLENGNVTIYENGAWIDFGAFPAYQMGDVLRIERTGSTVQYFQNGTLLHTSVQVSTEDLTAKGFFYPQGASVAVSASFSSSASPDAYYEVQAGDSWASISGTLFGSPDVADELEAALGSPVLTDGLALTGIPSTITDDDAIETVPPYYIVPASTTWESLANTMYGNYDAAPELETAVSGTISLTAGSEILQSDLPSTLIVVDNLPPVDYDVIATAITPEAYTTPIDTTWESLATTLYGSPSVASALETHLTEHGYSLADDLLIATSDLPESLGGMGDFQTVQYVYNQAGQLIAEYNENGEVIKEYIWLGDKPVVQIADGAVYYYHNDHLNTPQFMTDENQTVVWQVESQTPFGLADVNEDVDGDGQTVVNNLRFPGQYFDKETGLHYNWHRYYDPNTGRYTQSDPMGLYDGPNTYAYVHGNPINSFDPNGLNTLLGHTLNEAVTALSRGVGVTATSRNGIGPRQDATVLDSSLRGVNGASTAGFGVTTLLVGTGTAGAAVLPLTFVGVGSYELGQGANELVGSLTGANISTRLLDGLINIGVVPDPFQDCRI